MNERYYSTPEMIVNLLSSAESINIEAGVLCVRGRVNYVPIVQGSERIILPDPDDSLELNHLTGEFVAYVHGTLTEDQAFACTFDYKLSKVNIELELTLTEHQCNVLLAMTEIESKGSKTMWEIASEVYYKNHDETVRELGFLQWSKLVIYDNYWKLSDKGWEVVRKLSAGD